MLEKIVIIGNGGHAKSVVDALESSGKYEIAGYIIENKLDRKPECDYPVIGQDNDLADIYKRGIHNAAIGIGFLGKGTVRNELYTMLKKIGFNLPVICDPTAIVSHKTLIEEGSFIGKGVIINAYSHIEKMCIINTGAIVEHECHIEKFSHISVGAVLCGNVHIGEKTFIGANATIIHGVQIESQCLIGAGEVIRKDIMKNSKVALGNIFANNNSKY